MQDIDRVLSLSAEVQSLREALVRKESELRALLRGAGAGAKAASSKAVAATPVLKAEVGPGRSKKKAPRGKAAKASSKGNSRGRKDGAEGGSVMDAILAALASSKESMNVAQIAAMAGAKPTSVSTLLQRLVARGQAKKVSKGQYAAS